MRDHGWNNRVPVYAAMTDQQKAELDALNKQIVELQKQIVDKYSEAGQITKDQADNLKANMDAAEQYREKFSQSNGAQTPVPGYGPGYGPGYCWGYGGAMGPYGCGGMMGSYGNGNGFYGNGNLR
ncbi:MAG: YckD family protein [Desulfitobacteriaceae bacterium]